MTELLDALLTVAVTAVLTLGGVAIRHLADWLRLRADGEVRAYLIQVLDRAVDYGLAEARRRAFDGTKPVPAELARDYVVSRVPDALARFGMDTAALDQMIRARLPKPPLGPG